jgi:phosphoserine phosphatase RsbX
VANPVEQASVIDWAWAGAAFEGGESGDLHVVAPLRHGALLGVIDGLGHGPEAALAAREAAAILEAHSELPVQELIERCHVGIRKTRGVVMTLASLDTRSSTIDWCGVGNVEAVLFRARAGAEPAREAISARGGVVGYRLPPMKVRSVSIATGDLLVLATDGIRSAFAAVVDVEDEPQFIADSILDRCAMASDDALVLVARYRGAPA